MDEKREIEAECLKRVGEWLDNNAYAKSSVESGRIIRRAIEQLKRGEMPK